MNNAPFSSNTSLHPLLPGGAIPTRGTEKSVPLGLPADLGGAGGLVIHRAAPEKGVRVRLARPAASKLRR